MDQNYEYWQMLNLQLVYYITGLAVQSPCFHFRNRGIFILCTIYEYKEEKH